MATDTALLELYAQTRDAEAFGQLVQRHSGVVYGTALRITSSDQDAQDVAQQCFLDLARKSAGITSVSGWLHRAATHRALDLVRNERTRKRHETQAMNGRREDTGSSWEEVAPCVDEALEALPEELRVPVVMHFLEGNTQAQVAERLGCNQSTVSRRIERGTDELRTRLKKKGIVASVAVLTALLDQNGATAAPPTLTAVLGKMALAGVGESGAAAAAAGSGAAVGGKLGMLLGVLVVTGASALGYVVLHDRQAEPPARPPIRPPATQQTRGPQESEVKAVTEANDPTRGVVKREGTRVWIQNVPAARLGHLDDDWAMQLRGMQLLLKHRGQEAELDELLAFSGEAFNLCHSDRWELRTCLSLPTNSLGDLAKAYGYDSRWLTAGQFQRMKRKGPEACRKETRAVLDALWREMEAGRPVLVSGIDGHCGNWYVAAGYDRASSRMYYVGGEKPHWGGISGLNIPTCGDPKVGMLGFWDSRVRGAIRPGFLGGWWSDVAFAIGERTRRVSVRDRALATLRLATHMFRPGKLAETPYFGVTYYFGEKAYEHWAADLHELDYPADVAKPRPRTPEIFDLSTMVYQVQQIVRGRSAAAKFCGRAATPLPVAAAHLHAAAKSYREEATIADKVFASFLSGNEEDWQAWLSEESNRESGVAAIRRMLGAERAAGGEIEKALELLR